MNHKVLIILGSDGIRYHSLEIQIRIQLHQRKEHQRGGVLVDLTAV